MDAESPASFTSQIEEGARGHDARAAESTKLEQGVIACDDQVGSCSEGTFENAIVRLVASDRAYRLARMDEDREVADGRPTSGTSDVGPRRSRGGLAARCR